MVVFYIFGILKSWRHAATFSKSGGRQGLEKQGFYPNTIEPLMHPVSKTSMKHQLLISAISAKRKGSHVSKLQGGIFYEEDRIKVIIKLEPFRTSVSADCI